MKIDGIDTAMEIVDDRIKCPCGWERYVGVELPNLYLESPRRDYEHAIRFHYTNCGRAKVTPPSPFPHLRHRSCPL